MDEETELKPPSTSPLLPRRDSRFTPGAMLADRFRIVALLGKGGMGEVYRAEDIKLGQQVALKFLPIAVAADAAKLERLYREVRLGRQVSHPNVCRVYDVMEWEGHHFISMEYIDGEDLASLLRRIGKLPPDKALDIARDLCAGLAAAHSLGIIHRDLKPANVMIDGRGTARITDFGLAAIADDPAHREEIAGTPAYMAPEQISGGETTARTDLYALGLILYEMFTGKRLLAGSRPHSLSHEVKDVDPAVQRVILRCLEERPESRPPSIHSVIAALPGGDPLQAAVDAGETPSPEMVAAAGETGELRPAIAWALIIAVILLIVLNAALSQRTMLYGRVSLPKKPDALAERGRDILAEAGYTQRPADTAFNLGWNNDYFNRARKGAENLENVRPSPVVFYYRESPRELLAETTERRVSPIDPPMTLSRMANVELDASGRLIRFTVVPPQVEDPPAQPKRVDWSRLIAETGIDATTLRPVRSRWRAPVDSDEKAAWEGRYREQPGVTVRIETASQHGRPVWLSVIPPWQAVDRPFAGLPTITKATQVITAVIGMTALVAAIFFARRNLRRSRGDRKGAWRLALLILVLVLFTRLLRVDHVWDLGDETQLLGQLISEAVLAACVSWILYIGLEPYFRRRWPRLLIGWTRLFAGGFRDPMVGRDVLVGALTGCAASIVSKLAILAPPWFGLPAASPVRTYFTALTQLRHLGFMFFNLLQFSIALALLHAFLFLLFRVVTRSTTAALVMLGLTNAAVVASTGEGALQFAAACVMAVLLVVMFRRYGLLSLAVYFTFSSIMDSAPLTLDTSVWYFGRSFFLIAVMSLIASYAFWISLAAQPAFGLALLEED